MCRVRRADIDLDPAACDTLARFGCTPGLAGTVDSVWTWHTNPQRRPPWMQANRFRTSHSKMGLLC